MRTPSPRSQRRALLKDMRIARDVVSRAGYVGSAEHKDYPSPAGPPRLRADATKCDPALHDKESFDSLTALLRTAMSNQAVGGPVEGQFPRYVWVHHDNHWYEARLTNRENGDYKGYEIRSNQVPRGLLDG